VPIYAYRCSACGHAQDVLQKLSDPLLTSCPECGRDTYEKQVTAAGFRLKGSGWYETDFRGKRPAEPAQSAPAAESSAAATSTSTPSGTSAPASPG